MPSFNSDHRDIPQPKAFHIILQFKYSRRDMSLTLGSIIQRQRNCSMNNLEETNIYQFDGPEPLHRKTMTLYLEKKMEKRTQTFNKTHQEKQECRSFPLENGSPTHTRAHFQYCMKLAEKKDPKSMLHRTLTGIWAQVPQRPYMGLQTWQKYILRKQLTP